MANINTFFEKYKKEIFIVLGGALLIWCVSLFFVKKEKPNMAFYHWKTNLDLSQDEENLLLKHKKSPLYLHIMDLVWDEERNFAVPTAQLRVTRPIPMEIPIIPVIFITNEVFEKTPLEQVENMAVKVSERLNDKLFNTDGETPEVLSLQIDCDWTVSTKEKYFAFLEKMNNSFSFPVTATIRLHQVKFYEKTGVPPVKRGVLMFYNMGDLSDANTQNSILDLETAKSYMVNFDKYPLSLDVALPLFSWGVVRRDGKVVHLLNGLKGQDLSDTLQYKHKANGTYKVLESAYLKSYYCYEDDEIRLESATIDQLKAASTLLSKHLKNEARTICFYHLDYETLQSYPPQALEELIKCFE